jgi:hypothetical protein
MATGLVLTMAVPAMAADAPSAQLTFSDDTIAAGVGYTWGGGKLHFAGHDYSFSVSGVSFVDVGAAHLDGSGEVYNLRRIEDFPGIYYAAAAGVTIIGGKNVAVLQNDKGVRIYVHSTSEGVKLNVSADGITLAMK